MMRTRSTTHMIAPLMLTLLLAILTLACGLFGPSEEDIANRTAIAALQATVDKQSNQKTMTVDASNRHTTATEAAHTAQAILSTQKAQEKQDKTATADAISTATAGPALAEVNAPAGWGLKFYDGFHDNNYQWPLGSDDSNQWVHTDWVLKDSALVVTTKAKQGFSLYGYPYTLTSRRSYYVMVDASLRSGEPASSYGLVVDVHPAEGEFYSFEVTDQGFWSVDMRKGTYWAPIQSGQSTLITEEKNHLAVKATDSDFIFYINGEQIAIVHDDRLEPLGRAGVIVGANYGGAESVFVFENFTILAP